MREFSSSPLNERAPKPARFYIYRWFFGMLLVMAIIVAIFAFNHRQRPFDSNGWRNAHGAKNYTVMFGMADDLIIKLESQKPSRDDLLQLLGEPDVNTSVMARYRLGTHWRNTILADGWNLTVYFDSSTQLFVKAHIHPG